MWVATTLPHCYRRRGCATAAAKQRAAPREADPAQALTLTRVAAVTHPACLLATRTREETPFTLTAALARLGVQRSRNGDQGAKRPAQRWRGLQVREGGGCAWQSEGVAAVTCTA